MDLINLVNDLKNAQKELNEVSKKVDDTNAVLKSIEHSARKELSFTATNSPTILSACN